MFAITVVGGRPVVVHEGCVEIQGPGTRITIKAWVEDDADVVEVISEAWRNASDIADEAVLPPVTIYRGLARGDGTQPGAVDAPKYVQCPKPTCGYQWVTRVAKPWRCPKCWLRLRRKDEPIRGRGVARCPDPGKVKL